MLKEVHLAEGKRYKMESPIFRKKWKNTGNSKYVGKYKRLFSLLISLNTCDYLKILNSTLPMGQRIHKGNLKYF